MLRRERGEIKHGVSFNLIEEAYSGYSIYNINFEIAADSISGLTAKDILSYLDSRELSVLFAIHFKSKDADTKSDSSIFYNYLKKRLPIMTLDTSLNSNELIQLVCTNSKQVSDISNSSCSGRILRHNEVNMFYLNSIVAEDKDLDEYAQTYDSFKVLTEALEKSNLKFYDVSRTWLYANRILSWYDELNSARSRFFTEENVFDRFIPASTGIGSGNYLERDILLAAMGFSRSGSASFEMLSSPLQSAALDYKSSFSRAVKVKIDKGSKLLISGTASIDIHGKTEFINDVPAQIKKTFEIIKAILEDNRMSFKDVTRSIAYFPSVENESYFDDISQAFGLDKNYVLKVRGTVCRDDLLFELEVDAYSQTISLA